MFKQRSSNPYIQNNNNKYQNRSPNSNLQNFQNQKKQYGPAQNILNRINGNYVPNPDLANKKYRFKCDSTQKDFKSNIKNNNKVNQTYNKSPIKYNQKNSNNNINQSGTISNISGIQQSNSKTVDFEKQLPKRKGSLYKDWYDYQKQGQWEQKPNKDISPIRFVIESEKMFSQKNLSPKGQNRSVTPTYKELYEQNKKRDFTSQIQTLPGPHFQNERQLNERPVTPQRPVHPINIKIQESYYFKPLKNSQSTNQINVNKENYIPSQKYDPNKSDNKIQEKYTSYTRDINRYENKSPHYPLKDFMYRTPRNFLTTNQQK